MLAHMFVIAFARFVVVAEHARAIHNESEPILEFVDTPGNWRWHTPYYNFDEGVFGNWLTLVEYYLSLHVGKFNNN